MVTAPIKLKEAPWKKSYDKPRQYIKKQRYYFADKSVYSPKYGFSNSHVHMWGLDHKECWVLEKTLESPLDSKEIKPVNPKGNKPWNIHWKDWCWS